MTLHFHQRSFLEIGNIFCAAAQHRDAELRGEFDEGPGTSANWMFFYCSSQARLIEAVSQLEKVSSEPGNSSDA